MAVALRVKLNYDDLLLFPNDGKRHELIDGEHLMSPSPRTHHQTASLNLAALLLAFVRKHKRGRIFTAPVDVCFSDWDVVVPDIVFIARERVRLITLEHIRGAPDLIVEILSPITSEVDRKMKFKLYEKYGVREYWILDPDDECVEIFTLRAGGYKLLKRFMRGQKARSEVLTGFICAVDDIFAVG